MLVHHCSVCIINNGLNYILFTFITALSKCYKLIIIYNAIEQLINIKVSKIQHIKFFIFVYNTVWIYWIGYC